MTYPVDEGSLGVEQVELVVESGPGSSDAVIRRRRAAFYSRCGVGQHTQGSRDLGEITSGDKCGGLIADTELP
jgi:hypothetical protein